MSQADADSIGRRGTDEGGKMKETGTTHWYSPNTGATNESGFSALPGGYRSAFFEGYHAIGFGSFWWSSSEYSGLGAWYRDLSNDSSDIGRRNDSKLFGFSLRCVKD